MTWTRKSSCSPEIFRDGRHRFEHWYRDNQVYFITSRCRGGFAAFASEPAKAIFWDRFSHYAATYTFTPWVATLVDNHYHVLGHLREGESLGPMMQKLHGSVAKLVNDLLPSRHLPFWRESKNKSYFDGCIRDEMQCRRAYRYTLTQAVRHGICRNWRDYPHTRVMADLEECVRFALERRAFLEGVPYKRYAHGSKA